MSKYIKDTCTIFKTQSGGDQYKFYLSKCFLDKNPLKEIVFNYRNLSFREAMLDDNKRIPIAISDASYLHKSIDDMDSLVGNYEIEQEGDIYFLIKIDPFEYGNLTRENPHSVSVY